MDQDLHNRLYKFLKQELADQELNSLVLKQLNNKTYKISTYRLTKDTSTVESSTGQIYQFVSLTPAVVYCCLMAINHVNDAQIILTLNDELARLNEKTQTTRKRLRRVSNSFDIVIVLNSIAIARIVILTHHAVVRASLCLRALLLLPLHHRALTARRSGTWRREAEACVAERRVEAQEVGERRRIRAPRARAERVEHAQHVGARRGELAAQRRARGRRDGRVVGRVGCVGGRAVVGRGAAVAGRRRRRARARRRPPRARR